MCITPQAKKVTQDAAASQSVASPIVSEQRGPAAAMSEGENGAGSSAEKQHEAASEIGSDWLLRTNNKKERIECTISKPRETALETACGR